MLFPREGTMRTLSNKDHLIYCISERGGLCIGTDSGGFRSWSPDCPESIAGEMYVRVKYPSARRLTEEEFWIIANARYEDYMHLEPVTAQQQGQRDAESIDLAAYNDSDLESLAQLHAERRFPGESKELHKAYIESFVEAVRARAAR